MRNKKYVNSYLTLLLIVILLYFIDDVNLFLTTDAAEINSINNDFSCVTWKPFDLRVLKWSFSFVLVISILLYRLKKVISWYLLLFSSIINSLSLLNIVGGNFYFFSGVIDVFLIIEILSFILFFVINKKSYRKEFGISNKNRIIAIFVSAIFIFLIIYILKEFDILKHDIVGGVF